MKRVLVIVCILMMIASAACGETMYSGAIEDFLLPVEEFSWERECTPEFVMVHFTSAVVEHRVDLFNMDYIR